MDVEDLALPRCICIHSAMQLVDLTLNSVLLHHGLLPLPVDRIPRPPPSGLVKSIGTVDKVRSELRSAFRSRHRKSINQVVVAIGPSPMKPLNHYRIPITVCEGQASTSSECGECCGELSPDDARKVNRFLFKSFPPEGPKSHGLKLFVYLHAYDALVGEGIEESNPVTCKNDHSVRFNSASCDHSRAFDDSIPLTWLRIIPFIVQGKAD